MCFLTETNCGTLACTSAYDRTRSLQACYALGYNLAIEYLADFEKTWMLDSFRHLDRAVLQPQGRRLTEWLFLEVRLLIRVWWPMQR